MNKLILSAAFLTSLSSFGAFETINIQNFSGQYTAPEGTGTATKFLVPDFDSMESKLNKVDISITEENNGYLFTYGEKEYFFENPPAFLKELKMGEWNNIGISANNKRFSVDVPSIKTQSTQGSFSLKSFKANCTENDSSIPTFGFKLIDACTTNANIKLSKIKSIKKASANNILNTLEKVVFNYQKSSGDLEVSNLAFTNKNHSFSLKVTAKTSMKATVKMKGQTWFQKNSNTLKIKINSAKAGLINIKNMMFKELAKVKSETMTVKKPYIYIKFEEKK